MSFVPYFTAGQLEMLYARQRGSRLSESKWQSNRNVATGFVQAVASRLFLYVPVLPSRHPGFLSLTLRAQSAADGGYSADPVPAISSILSSQ